MASDYTFSCGETHALLLMGKQSVMVKAFKDFKADKERMNLKDFSRGFCHFEKNDDFFYAALGLLYDPRLGVAC